MKAKLGRRVGPYDLTIEFDPSKAGIPLSEFEELAKQLNSVLSAGPLNEVIDGQAPSIAGATSASDAVIRMFESDWGVKPRNIREVMAALNANGTYLPITTLSSILFHSIKKGRLRRWKDGRNFVYARARIA